jgi:hypothetical protein
MNILYPVIGEPFVTGVLHEKIASLPLTDVVGAAGASGSLAHRIVNTSDMSLYP